ncbi:MAG TPA: outer membrane lipoprotein carrier protein LolA [Candidatus Polarisedimenticolia bacterium]|jgi:outer membrane lipoprotein carrier protein|nr:outer membrane lipoprotein carrier protein LolA [Candidatus Polarisedimenticolia bacterium]
MTIRMRLAPVPLVVALLCASPALPAPAQEPAGDKNGHAPSPAPADPILARILQEFDQAQRDTSTLVARFTEKKDLRLLARPVISRGELYYNRPNQVRWEYLEPDRKVFVITEDRYMAYYPALKRAEEVPIKKFVGKRLFRFIGLGQSIEELGKYYEFQLATRNELKDTHLLVLVPRKKKLRDRVAEMKIWVDDATHLPRQLQYVEADGDSTLLTFHDLRSNVDVAAGRFRLELPKDVVVSDSFNGFSLGEQSF